uniref:Circadian clock-controlled protein n=1 Tax=Zeugodacus cucurbitae TaxID=28588 RepID=A0A0A1WCE9_ZEUCU
MANNNNDNRQNNNYSRISSSRLSRVTAAHAQPDLRIRRISLLAMISKLLLQCSLTVIVISCVTTNLGVAAQGQITVDDDFARLMGKCKTDSAEFDDCMKDVFNDLRAYFPTGVPAYNIKPFDPHRSPFVELRRGDQNNFGGFKLILRNISEYGWSRSEVTRYRTDFANKRIIYAQYFPEKSLDGWYEFSGKILGTPIKRSGFWNMTLYDYSQTTSVRRLGAPGALLKVHVEIDRIGGLKMHVGNALAEGRERLDNFADGVINSMWPIGFPVIKPLINELVSSAFTDIFNESFRKFPITKFLS